MKNNLLLVAAVLLFASITFGQDIQKEFDAALKFVDSRDYTEAIDRLSAIDRKAKDIPQVKYYLGICYSSLKMRNDAISAYQEAVRLKPDFYNAHIQLGNELDYEDRYDEAIASYNRAIKLKPDDASAYFEIGIAQKRKGRNADAEKSFRTVVRLTPDYSPGHVNLGVALIALNRSTEAVPELQKALTLAGDDDLEAHRQLGLAYHSIGRYSEAITQYKKVISLDPKFADAYYGLGNVYFKQKLYPASILEYQKAIELNPRWKEANTALGNAFYMTNKYDKALTHYQTAVYDGEDNKDTLYFLGVCYVKERIRFKSMMAKPSFRSLSAEGKTEVTATIEVYETKAKDLVAQLLPVDAVLSKKLNTMLNGVARKSK
jgi:tetratricopeptide (TPR) repeat protein